MRHDIPDLGLDTLDADTHDAHCIRDRRVDVVVVASAVESLFRQTPQVRARHGEGPGDGDVEGVVDVRALALSGASREGV